MQPWTSLLVNNPLGGVDTLIQGPRREFALFAANRLTVDSRLRNARFMVIEQNKVIDSQAAELGFKDHVIIDRDLAIKEMGDNIGVLKADKKKLEDKNAALKTWATLGKIGTFTISAGLVGLGVIAIVDTVKD